MKTVLITGGLGFIGSHLTEHIFKTTDWNIVIIDKLNYASHGFDRLKSANLFNHPRIKIFTYDLTHAITKYLQKEIGHLDYIFHLAAETHVDNSIEDPVLFIYNNIMSTTYILEYARQLKLTKFIYFSTDEVYGSIDKGNDGYLETDPHKPSNPYSASKSGAESICYSYYNTYKVPLIIANVMNVFGERQHCEKFIPKVIKKILNEEELDIHCYEAEDAKRLGYELKDKIPGSRFYIHARNVSAAILFLVEKGKVGDKYNIVGEKELDNLELALLISKIMDKELKYKLSSSKNRLGHDLRYALNGDKMKNLGWSIPKSFEDSLTKVVRWTLRHPLWLNEECQVDGAEW